LIDMASSANPAFDKTAFERQVKQTISKYKLLSERDRVIVACSGGKDSTTALYLAKKFGYNPEALIIDLSTGEYFRKNLANLRNFCREHGIKLHVVNFNMEFGCPMCSMSAAVAQKHGRHSCSVCGVLKRYLLNKKARELGATKLVFGHNLDDEAQTVLMNLMSGNTTSGLLLGPSTGKSTKAFVARVKLLCFSKEADIAAYSKAMKFPVIYEKCPCSIGSFRHTLRVSLNSLEEKYPGLKKSLFSGYLEMEPLLRSGGRPGICSVCGEPSRNEKCAACLTVEMAKV
jgi:tRNA-5-methyluridine54 2-sulfurtransferase